MNIFVLDLNPIEAARALCDQHLGKAGILEATQILHAALHRKGISDGRRPYNPGGRFARWAAEDSRHFEWLLKYAQSACGEWLRRFGMEHAGSARVRAVNAAPWGSLGCAPPTSFARSESVNPDLPIVEAYRAYYREKRLAWQFNRTLWEADSFHDRRRPLVMSWTRRDAPAWLDPPES